jgi:hypothetical protein
MKNFLVIALVLLAFESSAQQIVDYRVTFSGSWVASDSSSYPSSAHFTDLVGATHSPGNAVWKRGALASSGVEDVAELGANSTIQTELSVAFQEGTTGPLIKLPSLFNLPNSVSRTITVDIDKPNVSLISMLAPSPDWFVGVSDLALRSGGQWRQSISVDLHPYDAGTEEGTTFSLSNASTSPAEPIVLISSSPFFLAKPVVGRLKFDLLTQTPVPAGPMIDSQANISSVVLFLLGD